MTDPDPNYVTRARRYYTDAGEAFRLNPTKDNLATYEATRQALLLAEADAGISTNDIELGDADFERPFPDSDEAIRALQDIAEGVEELEAECYRLRAELKTALAERDEAKGTITRMRDGYEGCCPLCETVGILNVKLLAERDAARREMCVSLNGNMKQAHEYAAERGWDCFPD